VGPASFKLRFCERYRCSEAHFERCAFKKLLYPRAKLIAPLLLLVAPKLFAVDLEFIRNLAEAADSETAANHAVGFQYVNHHRRSLLRTKLRLRVSGQRATKLADELFKGA